MDEATLNLLAADLAAQVREIDAVYHKIHQRVAGFETDAQRRDSLGYRLHNLYCAFADLFQIPVVVCGNHANQDFLEEWRSVRRPG